MDIKNGILGIKNIYTFNEALQYLSKQTRNNAQKTLQLQIKLKQVDIWGVTKNIYPIPARWTLSLMAEQSLIVGIHVRAHARTEVRQTSRQENMLRTHANKDARTQSRTFPSLYDR